MTNHFATDVLICGAGAAGLTLAIDLARRGVSFRLIEKMEQPFHGSRGKGIQPRTQEIFADLGILDKVVAAGGLYPKLRNYQDDGSFTDAEFGEHQEPTAQEPYHLALMVPQFLTERVLRERLAELGHQAEFGCELIGFEQDASGVTARVVDGKGEESLRARWLVGADGGRSFVRHALGVGFPGKTLGVRAIVADVTVPGLSRDVWHRFGEKDMQRQIMLCPLAGTDLFQVQGPIPLEGDVDLSAEGLTALIAARSGRADIVATSVSWASAYQMNARLADSYRVGRTFLIGDAAHIHPPTGGQGLNTSVQDAYNLGWKLGAVLAGAADSLLDTYEEERRPVAQAMLGLATKLLDEAKQSVLRRGRDVHQLDIGYPGSSLAVEKSKRPVGLMAGSRAPDVPVLGAAGQASHLFELFKGPHWSLLAYEDDGAIPPRRGLHIYRVGPTGDIVDAGGHVQAAYGLIAGDRVLVRPDGYVAAIFDKEDKASLDDYLAKMGLGANQGERP